MIKIEFPADRADIGEALGQALLCIYRRTASEPVEIEEYVNEATSIEPTMDAQSVEFNADYCSKGFTAAGLWKRKRGVSQEDYDAWRNGHTVAKDEEPARPDTVTAFVPTAVSTPAPANFGALMGWISEHQAAGRLTQQHITDAYDLLGLNITDFFKQTPDVQQVFIKKLYGTLVGVVNG